MSNTKKFRSLFPEEVECRVAKVFKNGISVVIYKDARVDMNLLDEYFPNNWEDSFERKGETLYCTVTLYTDNGPRHYSDCGTPSNAEAAKGECSDSFKRACTKAGIGRGLYTAPFIWIPAHLLGAEVETEDAVKEAARKARLKVSDIEFADSRSGEFISYFEILSEATGEIVFSWSNKSRDSVNTVTEELGTLRSLMAKVPKISEKYLLERYKVNSLKEIADSRKLYADCKTRLEQEIKKAESAKEAALDSVASEPALSPKPAPVRKPKDPDDDPLNAFIEANNESVEDAPAPASPEMSPEDVLFNCSDEAPDNVLALRGMRIGDLPLNYIKEFARKNARIRVTVAQESLDAIEAVKQAM